MSDHTGIIAHRGYNGWYPENTHRSFDEALKLDVAGVECDVNLTKDGEVVVIHDQTVDRTSDGSGAVGDMTLKELRALNVGTTEDPQRIMRLDELLDLVESYPGKQLLIETKHPSPFGARLEESVAEVLRNRRLDADPRFSLISFNPEAIARFRNLLPSLQSFLLLEPEEGLPQSREGATGFGPSIRQARSEADFFGGVECPTYVWTVNLPKDMAWCRDNGVELMATDLPELALEVLSRS
ncbi:glycerophosphodiester phosphodiesterase [Corynebacterium minutissimum]|uniref:Glycerophosphoryl diester phosphodiesterase n=1 Tax=Corynebacterium minutissimum TaxID=38301 RepID=A0A376CYY7_9CORY|nr:glycerophosphodiester phosphodiesterase family protein [Corynebacterium minutissimum]QRP61031.1 glycerophosphodiester phosphodiesterase [Corynebacterium minutissimum]STC78179.1 glycerophosphoryl diester phosphodiesterase [Corynebacterium minutissimum]